MKYFSNKEIYLSYATCIKVQLKKSLYDLLALLRSQYEWLNGFFCTIFRSSALKGFHSVARNISYISRLPMSSTKKSWKDRQTCKLFSSQRVAKYRILIKQRNLWGIKHINESFLSLVSIKNCIRSLLFVLIEFMMWNCLPNSSMYHCLSNFDNLKMYYNIHLIHIILIKYS